MELYIQIKNGQPFEHPIIGDNFRESFPHIDTNNLPPNFARFERIPLPALGVYEIYENTTYERDGAGYKDVHHVRPMTEEEKQAKQDEAKAQWAVGPNWASWVFDEKTCSFTPPIPYPNDGKPYRWDEETTSWTKPE